MTASAVRFRSGRPEDLAAIVALDRATELAPHWPVAAYATILGPACDDPACDGAHAHAVRYLIVAERLGPGGAITDASLAGFAVGWMHPALPHGASAGRVAELEDVVVAVGVRRTGIGRALCAAVLDWCRMQGATEVTLEVRAGNAGALALYERLGFQVTGRRPRYYRDPDDDAVAMVLRCDSFFLKVPILNQTNPPGGAS
jgi:ribosomal-protein-alanine N-acetyltransferase